MFDILCIGAGIKSVLIAYLYIWSKRLSRYFFSLCFVYASFNIDPLRNQLTDCITPISYYTDKPSMSRLFVNLILHLNNK